MMIMMMMMMITFFAVYHHKYTIFGTDTELSQLYLIFPHSIIVLLSRDIATKVLNAGKNK